MTRTPIFQRLRHCTCAGRAAAPRAVKIGLDAGDEIVCFACDVRPAVQIIEAFKPQFPAYIRILCGFHLVCISRDTNYFLFGVTTDKIEYFCMVTLPP